MCINNIKVFKTISEIRNLSEVSRYSKIPYSQVSKWEASAKKGIKEDEYFTLLVLEYYKRENRREIINFHAGNKEIESVGEEARGGIFPIDIYDTYISSNILWKKNIIEEFRKMDKHLFKEQRKYLEAAINTKYKINPPGIYLDKIENEKIKHL